MGIDASFQEDVIRSKFFREEMNGSLHATPCPAQGVHQQEEVLDRWSLALHNAQLEFREVVRNATCLSRTFETSFHAAYTGDVDVMLR